MAWLNQSAGNAGLYLIVLDCCILLVFGLCFCLEYLEGGCASNDNLILQLRTLTLLKFAHGHVSC